MITMSATGESAAVRLFIDAAAAMNSAALMMTNHSAARAEMRPAGISRSAVRGFSASMRRSAQRLKPMATLRAKTMHRTTFTSSDSHHTGAEFSAPKPMSRRA